MRKLTSKWVIATSSIVTMIFAASASDAGALDEPQQQRGQKQGKGKPDNPGGGGGGGGGVDYGDLYDSYGVRADDATAWGNGTDFETYADNLNAVVFLIGPDGTNRSLSMCNVSLSWSAYAIVNEDPNRDVIGDLGSLGAGTQTGFKDESWANKVDGISSVDGSSTQYWEGPRIGFLGDGRIRPVTITVSNIGAVAPSDPDGVDGLDCLTWFAMNAALSPGEDVSENGDPVDTWSEAGGIGTFTGPGKITTYIDNGEGKRKPRNMLSWDDNVTYNAQIRIIANFGFGGTQFNIRLDDNWYPPR